MPDQLLCNNPHEQKITGFCQEYVWKAAWKKQMKRWCGRKTKMPEPLAANYSHEQKDDWILSQVFI